MTIWVSENVVGRLWKLREGGGRLLYFYRFKVWRRKLYSLGNFLQQLTEVSMLLRRGG